MKKEDTKLNILQKLLRKEAEPNLKDSEEKKALHDASEKGTLEICKVLISNGADPNLKDRKEKTALHYAAEKGSHDICQLLLSNRADPNIKDCCNRTALHWAAEKGTQDICQLLLSNGVDLTLKDRKEKTALHYAAIKGKLDICQLLLSNGADPNLKDREEKTALHYAAEEGTLDTFRLLLSNGANLNLKGGIQLETALIIALKKHFFQNCFAIAKYILEYDTVYYSLITTIDDKIEYKKTLKIMLKYTRKLPLEHKWFWRLVRLASNNSDSLKSMSRNIIWEHLDCHHLIESVQRSNMPETLRQYTFLDINLDLV